MRKVTTEYACDRCGKKVGSVKDLQKFAIEQIRRGRGQNVWVASDLCVGCESELLAAVESFFTAEDLPTLHSMNRTAE